MRRPRSTAARRVLELWDDAPFSARLHTRIRAWTAPFEALESFVPVSGRILEIGCGHGVFTTYLALSSPERTVVGIDIDDEKVALAQTIAARLRADEGSVAFEHRPSGELPEVAEGWDAIVFADVLYLLHPSDRVGLIERCVAALAPGGLLIVKEVDTAPKFKARLAQFQEFIATRVVRITRGDTMSFPSVVELTKEMQDAGLSTRSARLDKGYLHPHCVVIGTRTSPA